MTHNVAGGFDEQNFALLKKSNNLINYLAQQILEAHFTESIQEEIADELGFDILQIRKQRDPLFRQQVLRAYNYECATTVLRLPWKPPISNGNSTAGPARFQTAWRCAQSTIKPLIKVRLGLMKVCEFRCHPQ